ncbi:MAG: Eco57I restriction-modification methylase [Methanomassiliicoccales archaeon PtaU1.Bin030]|nr:MAG: Eco57I restriction-modification methylase [Methanomassiliicoccales archaeon PtaU1.Bin030]
MIDNGDHVWFSELRQNGMLISPSVLSEFLASGLQPIEERKYLRLRDEYARFVASLEQEETDHNFIRRWVDSVLEDFLGHEGSNWQKGPEVVPAFKSTSITKEALRPERVLLWQGSAAFPRYLVKIDASSKNVGMGRGRNEYSKLLELLRNTGVKLGVLTNGRQFRLVYAGLDHDCWIEWEVERWFEDALGKEQLAGFLSLCGPWGVNKRDGVDHPLYQAVLESRNRQGELSQVLGEQTRMAVEELLLALDRSIRTNTELSSVLSKDPESGKDIPEEEQLEALYQASIRIVMRTVVALFAESRDLLPKGNELYNTSYGIEGLFAQLNKAAKSEGEAALEEHYHSWPRLLAMFRLIHEGSSSALLPITAYGGGLFRKGDAYSSDPVPRALSMFEDARTEISDLTVFRLLRLLKIGRTRAKVGRSTKVVSGPVDFSDLRTEYIGMMYEGLLDYKLRKVSPEDEAMVFLNIGQQPALPFSLLRKTAPHELRDLIKELTKEKAEKSMEGEDEPEAEPEEPATDVETGSLEEDELVSELLEQEPGMPGEIDEQVRQWAREAAEAAGLIRKPRGKNKFLYEKEKDQAARRLILNIVRPGETYLIRSSGTRKGSGTFYTKPQLAVPTVRRTLEPLLYKISEEDGKRKLTPKSPEEILSVKICDPAMGSGSFLVASLNYVTDALYESLLSRNRFKKTREGTAIVLPFGKPSEAQVKEELVKRSIDDELFETSTKAQLKRYVVERCIYGVDINPLAVELAKLSLWIETMDRELPFGFLDHKLKAGNSLIGCWFDQFQEYPLMAWKREGGDKDHVGIHHAKGEWTGRIKAIFNEQVRPELAKIIRGQRTLESWEYGNDVEVQAIFERAVQLFEELHEIPLSGDGHERREVFYRDRIQKDEGLRALRDRFDLWCAVWFWPGEWLDADMPTPQNFYSTPTSVLDRARKVARHMQFFHWELEFPDVFITGKGGFDAVVGNPPWEASKPVSKEFFTLYDPIYRTYGKQEALSHQKELFQRDRAIEEAWVAYNATFNAMTNWVKRAAFPFGDPVDEGKGGERVLLTRGREADKLHDVWRKERARHASFADATHPFRYQGSGDINTYKLFLEHSHTLACKGGRIGHIVPSGIYTDKGTMELRQLFLHGSKWEWIFCFENRKKIFQIHSSFKFCPVIVEKGGKTTAIKTAFMRHDLADWEHADPWSIDYPIELIDKFSPKSKSILEIRSSKDLEILEKIYKNSVLLGDDGPEGWGIKYSREFDMTNDSWMFPPREWWEERGYESDEYGRWWCKKTLKSLEFKGKVVGTEGEYALPFMEGRSIDQYDPFSKGWVSGKGRSSVWVSIPFANKMIQPQYLMSPALMTGSNGYNVGPKVCFMDITSSTNSRSMISTYMEGFPYGHSASILTSGEKGSIQPLILSSVLNSFVFDFQTRFALGGLHLSWFILENLSLPNYGLLSRESMEQLAKYAARLTLIHKRFSPIWLELLTSYPTIKSIHLIQYKALTDYERIRIKSNIEAIIAELFGLSELDYAWILRNEPNDPKGFWRIDKEKPLEIRQTTLALAAFKELKRVGYKHFCELNNGEGWMIPEKLRFSVREDGTIDFDDPNGTEYEVASKLGPRFLDWQLEGTPEESWKECEMHARNILGEKGFEEFMKRLEESSRSPNEDISVKSVLDKAAMSTISQPSPQASLLDFQEEGK